MKYKDNLNIVEHHPYLTQLKELNGYDDIFMYHHIESDRFFFVIQDGSNLYDFISLTKEKLDYDNIGFFRDGILRRPYKLGRHFKNTVNERKYKKKDMSNNVLTAGLELANSGYNLI